MANTSPKRIDSARLYGYIKATGALRGMRLRDIALATGVSGATISRLKSDRACDAPSLLLLCRWAEVDPMGFLVEDATNPLPQCLVSDILDPSTKGAEMANEPTSVDVALTKAQSTNIEAYALSGGHLYVQFKDSKGEPGKVYRYSSSSEDELEKFAGFIGAESKGAYFAKNIRNHFRGEVVKLKTGKEREHEAG